MPDKPEEPGPNPQSCDIDFSQSRGWGHQGCLDHFQEGQDNIGPSYLLMGLVGLECGDGGLKGGLEGLPGL